MLFLKLVRIIRAQKKNTRVHNKSQSATITQNQEASSLHYKPNPPKLPNTNTLFPYSPNTKKKKRTLKTPASQYDHIPLALDLLFSPLGGPYSANALQECNVHNDSSLGGYFTLDMPFRTRLTIRLFNNTSSAVTYWVQPFISTFNSIPPSLSSLKLHSVTFRYFNTTYGNEYILMNFKDVVNGVHLKYVKMHIIGASGNWWESRVRIYWGY